MGVGNDKDPLLTTHHGMGSGLRGLWHLSARDVGEELPVGPAVPPVADHVDEVVDAVLKPIDAVQDDAYLLRPLRHLVADGDHNVVHADGDDAHQVHQEQFDDDAGGAAASEGHQALCGLGPV